MFLTLYYKRKMNVNIYLFNKVIQNCNQIRLVRKKLKCDDAICRRIVQGWSASLEIEG